MSTSYLDDNLFILPKDKDKNGNAKTLLLYIYTIFKLPFNAGLPITCPAITQRKNNVVTTSF